MNVGVILAGGEATRMPNKALLPIGDGLCAIESAAALLDKAYIDRTIIVVRGDGLLRRVLPLLATYEHTWETFPQIDGGIEGAITTAARQCSDEDNMVVTFCDNVYSVGDVNILKKQIFAARTHPQRKAACRIVERRQASELDGFTSGQGWVRRENRPLWHFAGWLFAQAGVFKRFKGDLISSLNALDFSPELCDLQGWYDIGTPEGYLACITDRLRG